MERRVGLRLNNFLIASSIDGGIGPYIDVHIGVRVCAIDFVCPVKGQLSKLSVTLAKRMTRGIPVYRNFGKKEVNELVFVLGEKISEITRIHGNLRLVCTLFSRVHRDSISRYVGLSICRSVTTWFVYCFFFLLALPTGTRPVQLCIRPCCYKEQ